MTTLKQYTFEYEVKIRGFLTKQESELIHKHLANHSDTKYYVTQGQFGFALDNYFKDRDFEMPWTSGMIDLTLKSFEQPASFLSPEERELKAELFLKLMEWFKAIKAEYNRIAKKQVNNT